MGSDRHSKERPRGVRVARWISYRSVEPIVAENRRVLVPAGQDRVDGARLFDRIEDHLEVIVHDMKKRVVCVVGELALGMAAYTEYLPDPGVFRLTLAPRTYQLLEKRDPWALFTLAHELGHVTLHATDLVRMRHIPDSTSLLARYDSRMQSKHEYFYDSEWQADAFASAFLAPGHVLRAMHAELGSVSVQLVRQRFGMSESAARRRLENYQKHLKDSSGDGAGKRRAGRSRPF